MFDPTTRKADDVEVMTVDDKVIEAITQAVGSAPEDHNLRLHLVTLLLSNGRAGEALSQCVTVLEHTPDHLQALDLAARSAEESGEHERSSKYRRLHTLLVNAASPAVKEDIDRPAPRIAGTVKVPLTVIDGGDVGPNSDDDVPDVERPSIRLADVAGMEQVKERIRISFLEPLMNPKFRRMYVNSLRGGLMLYGPPGCGKTHLARAVAGELGARFYAVGLSDVLDMYIGNSERNLKQIFEVARRSAPCVLFFDEVDALGQKRSHLKHSAMRSVVTQLLAELDGLGSNNEGLFVLAATNHPWDVDAALKRPGRFDRTLLVTPPDEIAREAILKAALRDAPTAVIDLGKIASRTKLFSGADLTHVCRSAIEYAMTEAVREDAEVPISQAHLERALSEIKPSTRSWFETAKNYALYANDGGTYDDLLAYIRKWL